MKAGTARILDRAEHSLRSAKLLFRDREFEDAMSRAYYAMFHSAQALLFENALATRKHSGVHALFGEHFAKPGLIDYRYHHALLNAFDRRLQADYDYEITLTSEDVSEAIQAATDFLQAHSSFFQNPPPNRDSRVILKAYING